MSTPELITYIQDSRAQGLTDQAIRESLIAAGWSAQQIETGFAGPTSAPGALGKVKIYKRKPVIIGAIVVVVLLLAAAAAGAYVYYIAPKPAWVMSRVLGKLDGLNVVKFQGSITGSLSVPNPLSMSFLQPFISPSVNQIAESLDGAGKVAGIANSPVEFDFQGGLDATDDQNPNFDINSSLSYQNFSIGTEVMELNSSVYARLTQASTVGLLDLTAVKNVWVKFDPSEFGATKAEDAADHLTDAQKQQVSALWAQDNPIEITKQLPDDKINGRSMFAYDYHLNSTKLIALEQGIYRITYGHDAPPAEQNYFNNINFTDGELWIGKKDYYVYKMNGGINVNTVVESEQVGAQVSWEINLSDFNQPLNLQAPTDFKTIQEAEKLFESLLSGQPTVAN